MNAKVAPSHDEPRHSGLAWFGSIPGRWHLVRAKRLFRCIDIRSSAGEEELLTVSSDRGVVPRSTRAVTMFMAESYAGHKLCWPGDLVINSLWAWAGGLGVSRHHGIVSTAYGVYRLREPHVHSPRFFHALLRSTPFRFELQTRSKGVWVSRLQLTDEAFLNAPVPVPPPREQAAIARFLDHADRHIQRYIAAKEKLIALLDEYKQVLVGRAVTGQIDVRTGRAYPAYKDAGLPWLKHIPSHWTVTRVKSEFQCLNSRRIPLSAPERGRMRLRRYDYYGASGVIDKVDEYLFDDELLLLAEDGANLVLRNLPLAIIARGKFWVNNHAHILKPRRGNLGYLAAAMESLSYLPWISGAAQPKLTQDRLLGIAIAVPPPRDQDLIAAFLREKTERIDVTVESTRREVSLVQEYRVRLIADVVTGKLDVRQAAAAMPDLDPTEAAPADLKAELDGAAAVT